MNYYEILGLNFNASTEEIKSSFRQLSKKYHPDINAESTVDYVRIVEAYKTLVDEEKRIAYNTAYLEELQRESVKTENIKSNVVILPYERVEYSRSLSNLIKTENNITASFKKRGSKDVSEQDVFIYVKPIELKIGVVALIEIPAKLRCPTCSGTNIGCYRCSGKGWVRTLEKIQFKIPPNAIDTEIIELDLDADYPKTSGAVLKMKTLRVRIVFI